MLHLNTWTALCRCSHLCSSTTALSWDWWDDFKSILKNHGPVKHCKCMRHLKRLPHVSPEVWVQWRAGGQLRKTSWPQSSCTLACLPCTSRANQSQSQLPSVLLIHQMTEHGMNKGARSTLYSLALWKLQCTKIKLLTYPRRVLENLQEEITSRKLKDPNANLLNHDWPWELNQGQCYLFLWQNVLILEKIIIVKSWQ